MSDDNEFARYLASYLEEHVHEFVFRYDDPLLAREALYKLIKEFMETLP